ncbi:response regulator [Acetobacter conturbans]|uniref:histidine kinase n=1 Tax=Acetobacter conturbans TaxID=1737472 RepID=A0ABX0K073_9PROT|nr:response regulator [Acetobacter conturbans]NHN88075.1 response regulator [Acetobacter conturbans]
MTGAVVSRDRVLLIDDEPEILVALTDLLDREFEVLTATSGREALATLADDPGVSVIVSDQRMRDMTGDALLAQARKISDAGTILLTGFADLDTVAAALNRGAITFYAAKPWDPGSLLAMVREAASACRTRQELATERALLRSLFDGLPLGLALVDETGRIMRLNERAALAFGRSVSDCLTLTEGEILQDLGSDTPSEQPEEDRPPVIRRVDGNGHEHWHRISRVPLTAPAERGAQRAVSVLIDQDVTDLIEMEKRARQADKMQAIGTLAGGIAHDFNNLLTAVLGSLELVQDLQPPVDPNISRLFTNAMDAARRGAVLTQKLLDFSRPRDLARRAVDIPQLLGQMQGLLAQSIGGGGPRAIPVRLELPAGILLQASTDPSLLEVALVNLCLNARDAQPKGGEIIISARAETLEPVSHGGTPIIGRSGRPLAPGRYVVISVTDRGVGMTVETQARIFEPFFTTKAVGSGIGLGLPMVYGFVQRNGGDVRVSSAPGAGTSIELWLPAVDAQGRVGPVSAGQTAQHHAPGSQQRSILVVDDDPNVAAVTVGFLSRAGFKVLECHNGSQALDLVRDRPDIGLVVMDLLMPEMNGDECARRISVLRPDLGVIFVTGFADRAILPPDAHVLAKPFTREALLSGVEELIPVK